MSYEIIRIIAVLLALLCIVLVWIINNSEVLERVINEEYTKVKIHDEEVTKRLDYAGHLADDYMHLCAEVSNEYKATMDSFLKFFRSRGCEDPEIIALLNTNVNKYCNVVEKCNKKTEKVKKELNISDDNPNK